MRKTKEKKRKERAESRLWAECPGRPTYLASRGQVALARADTRDPQVSCPCALTPVPAINGWSPLVRTLFPLLRAICCNHREEAGSEDT
jgi:hypothetical protein